MKHIKNKNKSILFIDLETSPLICYTWGTYEQNALKVIQEWKILCFAWKWLGDKKTNIVSLHEYGDDESKLVGVLWELFNQAEIICGHNCVEVNTPVLKQDLTWVKAGELLEGDKLVGFDEGLPPGNTLRDNNKKWNGLGGQSVRWIKPTTVTSIKIEKKQCKTVILSNGDKITTTPDHYWLARTRKDNFYKWISTEKLQKGFRLNKFWNVWEENKSYESGWLSGFISGEGTLRQSNLSFGIDFYQRPGSTWNQALEYCNILNIPFSNARTQRATGIGKMDTLATGLLGSKFFIAEIIGKLRIKRFIEKINWSTFGGLKKKNYEEIYVVDVIEAGEKEVAVMSTSEKTFFAGGYAMHNCDHFDIKKSTAKFIEHGLTPPATYKTVDTLKVARQKFKFTSNRLDALGQHLGLGKKLQTGGFELWDKCMQGDAKAWRKMEDYCKQDVRLLEKVYLKLRPWFSNHPNMNLYNKTESCCPNCGSSKVQRRGYSYTRVNKLQRWQCLECSSWHQSPLNNVKIR